jgi:uncharacterized membrane protein
MEEQYDYPDLSVGHVLRRSWEIFRANMGLVFAIAVVQVLILSIAGVIPVLPLLVAGPLTAGCNYTLVRLVRGEDVEIRDVFDGFKEFGRTLGVSLAEILLIVIGTILLIVPGVIVAVGLFPALYLVLDADHGVKDTLRVSWELMRGYKWDLFVLSVVVFLLCLLGVLALVIGAVFVGVYATVVMATAYDELSKRREA